MSTLAKFIGVVALLGATACVMGGPDDEGDVPLDSFPNGETLSLCRDMASRLAGTQATMWRIKGHADIVGVSVGHILRCVDNTNRTLQLGLILVEAPIPDGCGDMCEGFGEATPMPAYYPSR